MFDIYQRNEGGNDISRTTNNTRTHNGTNSTELNASNLLLINTSLDTPMPIDNNNNKNTISIKKIEEIQCRKSLRIGKQFKSDEEDNTNTNTNNNSNAITKTKRSQKIHTFKKFDSIYMTRHLQIENLPQNISHVSFAFNTICMICLHSTDKSNKIILGCNHMLCIKCLSYMLKNSLIHCNQCRQQIDLYTIIMSIHNTSLVVKYLQASNYPEYLIKCIFCTGQALSYAFNHQYYPDTCCNNDKTSNVNKELITECENGHCFCLKCAARLESNTQHKQQQCDYNYINKKQTTHLSEIMEPVCSENIKPIVSKISCSECKCQTFLNSSCDLQLKFISKTKTNDGLVDNYFPCDKCTRILCLKCQNTINSSIEHYYNPLNQCFMMRKMTMIPRRRWLIWRLILMGLSLLLGHFTMCFFGNGILVSVLLKRKREMEGWLYMKDKGSWKEKLVKGLAIWYIGVICFSCLIGNYIIGVVWDIMVIFAYVLSLRRMCNVLLHINCF